MFDECVSLKDKFSSDDVILEMDKGDPNDRVLYDMTNNIFRLLIVSEPFKEMLQKTDCGNVEFLPVLIKNQREKIEKEKYYIVNLIDYIDKDKSTIDYDPMDESAIFSVEEINVINKNIPENRDLFRAEYYPNRYIVSENLKNKIEDEEFEGIKFIPIEEFNSAIHK